MITFDSINLGALTMRKYAESPGKRVPKIVIPRKKPARKYEGTRKVKCVTTGEVFDSVSSASEATGICKASIYKTLRYEQECCGSIKDGKVSRCNNRMSNCKWRYL